MTKDIQRAILRACARLIGRKIDPVTKQVENLEIKLATTVTKSDVDELKQYLDGRLAKPNEWFAKELLPPGPEGPAGRDADPIVIADVVSELLGTDGLKTLIDLHVAASIAAYFEANPVLPGKDGAPGEMGPLGDRGEKGKDGADGVGLASAMIDRSGNLIVTKTNGESVPLGVVVGKDGARGSDGADGADFSEASIDYDGERSLIIRGKGSQIVKRMPIPMDRGYWREGMKAEKGDIVTQEGNAWIALKDTAAKPCRENDQEWRLFARKGRDGAQGPAGKEYRPPEPVKLGTGNG